MESYVHVKGTSVLLRAWNFFLFGYATTVYKMNSVSRLMYLLLYFTKLHNVSLHCLCISFNVVAYEFIYLFTMSLLIYLTP
jgi:hypothetical protein